MNWGLLALFAVILGAISASNLWLRRRAEAEREADSEASTGSGKS